MYYIRNNYNVPSLYLISEINFDLIGTVDFQTPVGGTSDSPTLHSLLNTSPIRCSIYIFLHTEYPKKTPIKSFQSGASDVDQKNERKQS